MSEWPKRETPYDAMLLVQPNYVRYGAKSPGFSDIGAARREWVQRGRWREFSLDEVGDQLFWYESEIGARDVIIEELKMKLEKNVSGAE